MYKVILSILMIILIVCLVIYFIVKYYFQQVVVREVIPEDIIFNEQIKRGLINNEFYKSLNKEEFFIESKDELKLRGIYIRSSNESNKTMIFVHGITVGLVCSIKYISMFLEKGWNVLIYDQRRHSKSEGKYSTYGYYEKEDLDLFVNWIINKKGEDEIIGLHGESMGAATVLQYAKINKYAKFIISDCSFSSLNELLERKIKEKSPLLKPILKLMSKRSVRKAKFSFDYVNPIEVVKKASIPIMFIHGDKDRFVPWDMSVNMYNSKEVGIKKLYIAKGARHAESIEVDKLKYEEEVMKFVDEVLNNIDN
ncbi:alpha/beta hydrolase [Clostridium algidicarnis]|uniref:Alpha/beta hydrolase n=1 Tax=Clostridium algidicarnis TaxID=37659 RepID=A0ABS6C3F1_9CLOT|nr:alpha/beta hydrolase [Clostridium algidicarnis]MBB6631728.1 alpha/beta hydrolase [Clostridium algidicarnis]MBB6697235.1 alpha/beta hydrolase [Clostridium algidicarnis]MBU3204505.1 alpha/beta hydrolase [Clostridium algidicarnis]MBU3206368.1 alpha/beta hydrolase [Clostridium algidicarnis]MBU3212411.1 alpha/beta hydrolase [Clostridium algidicarnis]